MKKFNKVISAVMASALALTMMAGCGDAASGSGSAGTPSGSDRQT